MQKKKMTIEDLARRMDERFTSIDRKLESIDKRSELVDTRFESLETYMRQGFTMLDHKIEYIYEHLDQKIENLTDSVFTRKV